MCAEGEYDDLASELGLEETPTNSKDCYAVVRTRVQGAKNNDKVRETGKLSSRGKN